MTPAQLNALANHPMILPYVAPGYADLDLTAFFNNPLNVAIGDDDGALIFGHRGHGVYEVHSLLGPTIRGKAVLIRVRHALKTMFTEHGALVIMGETPDANYRARAVNRAVGGAPAARTVDSLGRSCTRYILERETWVQSSAQ